MPERIAGVSGANRTRGRRGARARARERRIAARRASGTYRQPSGNSGTSNS